MKGRKPSTISILEDAITEAPKPPGWLSKEAKAEWKRIAPLLVSRGILTTGDLGTLEGYCVAYGTVRQSERTLQIEGITFATDKGLLKRNPAVAIQADAQNRMLRYATELGLTPVSRSRPAVRSKSDDDGPSPLDL